MSFSCCLNGDCNTAVAVGHTIFRAYSTVIRTEKDLRDTSSPTDTHTTRSAAVLPISLVSKYRNDLESENMSGKYATLSN